MNKNTALTLMGIESLHDWKELLIDKMAAGEDVIGVMPTASGKSAVFHSFALMTEQLVVVVEPHLALELDQVKGLREKKIAAAFLNSLLPGTEVTQILKQIQENDLRLLYLTPEMLQNKKVSKALKKSDIVALIVDEAHCIVKQGAGFREDYLRIGEFLDHLPKRPVVGAFTATATDWTVSEITRLLHMREPYLYRAGVTRSNITLSAIEIGNGLGGKKDAAVIEQRKREMIVKTLKKMKNGKAIVYSNTIEKTEKLCEYLQKEGFPVGYYHGKCTDKERRLADFSSGKIKIMTATSAFGLGVNLPDIRVVIHHSPLFGLDDYLQEAGRAGRDGKPAKALLLWHEYDFAINRYLLKKPKNRLTGRELNERVTALDTLQQYAADTKNCRWRLIRGYFGEENGKRCKCRCDNCKRKK